MQSVLFFTLIFLNQYLYQLHINCLCHFLFLYILIRIEKTIKIYQLLYRSLLFDILILYRHYIIFGNSVTPFRKVSAIYCNYYYYDSIHLTDFYTYYFLLGFHDQIYFQHKKLKTTHNRDHLVYRVQALNTIMIWGSSGLLRARFFSAGNILVLLWLSWSVTVTNRS